MRKTFGYHFYQRTKDVAMLQQIFGHSSPSITLRYIGINDEMVDRVLEDFSL
ncbi:site-specific integrase, partial [Pseudobacillus sp. 179-B 2D1 NHS]